MLHRPCASSLAFISLFCSASYVGKQTGACYSFPLNWGSARLACTYSSCVPSCSGVALSALLASRHRCAWQRIWNCASFVATVEWPTTCSILCQLPVSLFPCQLCSSPQPGEDKACTISFSIVGQITRCRENFVFWDIAFLARSIFTFSMGQWTYCSVHAG